MTSIWLSLYQMAGEMTLTYLIAYWLIPKFLFKRKYLSFITGIILFSIGLFIAEYPLYIKVAGLGRMPKYSMEVLWNCLMEMTETSHAFPGLFIAFKLFKNYYYKMEEKETLSKENIDAELQLLKAQIHPHFLFNTLNNIYSFTLGKSPQALALVKNLSDTLRYMVMNCDVPLVLLENELKMIKNYIELEKVRYGQRLALHMKITGDIGNKMIAPLLILPFIENSFKHGTSQVLDRPWIELHVSVEGNSLRFELGNSRPSHPASQNNKNGIGLNNIRKRLQLLYPERHLLKIEPGEETFFVTMNVPLEVIDKVTPKPLSYAE